MSIKFLGQLATGVAATTAAFLITTPGLASADVVEVKKTDGNGAVTVFSEDALKPGKGINIVCIIKEKDHGKKPHNGKNGPMNDLEPSDEPAEDGTEENSLKDGYKPHKKHQKSQKQSNESDVDQSNVIILANCGDGGASASAANSAAVAQGGSAAASGAGALDSLIPVGGVDGGDGGVTTPNTGLLAGGAGALAAAALGTVLVRRRRADETVA